MAYISFDPDACIALYSSGHKMASGNESVRLATGLWGRQSLDAGNRVVGCVKGSRARSPEDLAIMGCAAGHPASRTIETSASLKVNLDVQPPIFIIESDSHHFPWRRQPRCFLDQIRLFHNGATLTPSISLLQTKSTHMKQRRTVIFWLTGLIREKF
jgi:hypothetical protein